MRHRLARWLIAIACLAGGAALARAEPWSHYGGDAGGMRHSESTQIDRSNVGNLVRAWTTRTGHHPPPESAREYTRFSATPILAESKLALCTPYNQVLALDPGTGREIWRYDPQLPRDIRPANGFNCRGVSYWRDARAPREAACAARIFMGTNDHRLVALDLETGAPCAGFGENGVVTIDPGMSLRWPGEFQITSPPVIVGDVVIVGSSISDNGRREAPAGAVRAFDARTGAPRWSWDPIPRTNAEPLGWEANPREGHANAWAPMAADEARGLVFIPTTSASPDFFGGLRPGDNRHANSVVALEAATGRLRWAFQTVHHDVWDYDLPAQPLLATIRRRGEPVDVVIQVTKMGLVFTLDRETGEPVFPVQERRVPQNGALGEVLSPTQPFPTAPAPLAPSRVAPDEVFGLSPFDRAVCRQRIEAARAEGLYTPPSTQGTILYPFTGGGMNWGGAAFDPVRNRLYVNTTSAMHLITLISRDEREPSGEQFGDVEYAPMTGTPYAMTRETLLSPLGLPCNLPPWGSISAVDMGDGELAWRERLGTTEDLAPFLPAVRIGTPNVGGPLVTGGGLVFIGAAMDRYLRAFDADSGREIWQGRLPASGQATPMTYVWEGRQYVVIAAGGHDLLGTVQGDYVVAFALPKPGEAGPSLWSRTIDRPGGRWWLGFAVFVVLAGGLVTLWLRRKRKPKAA